MRAFQSQIFKLDDQNYFLKSLNYYYYYYLYDSKRAESSDFWVFLQKIWITCKPDPMVFRSQAKNEEGTNM